MNNSKLVQKARQAADIHLSQKSNEAIENLIAKFPQYIEAAIADPHTGSCRCERCYVITFEQEKKV